MSDTPLWHRLAKTDPRAAVYAVRHLIREQTKNEETEQFVMNCLARRLKRKFPSDARTTWLRKLIIHILRGYTDGETKIHD